MRSTARLGLAILAVSLLLGCNLRQIPVQLSGFDSYQIEGIWLWRLDEEAQGFERSAQIRIERTNPLIEELEDARPGHEFVSPILIGSGGGELALPISELIRDPANPDVVTLRIYSFLGPPGLFRASAYNAYGESPLSAEALPL